MKSTIHANGLLKILCLFALFGIAAAMPAAEIPVADFFKDPTYGGMALSPDGGKLAVAFRYKERLALAVIDMKTKQPKLLTAPDLFDVAGIRWVGNNRIVFTGIAPGDKFSPKNPNGGIFAIDADGKNARTLFESADQQRGKNALVGRFAGILDRYGTSTNEILVTYNDRRATEPDVYRLNVNTGSKTMVAMNPGYIREWLADHNGVVRAGMGSTPKERFIIYRDSEKSDWRELRRWAYDSTDYANIITPVAFDQDNKLLYIWVARGDAQTQAAALYDPRTDKIVRELYANDTYDVTILSLLNSDHHLIGYAYEGDRGLVPAYVDKHSAELHAMLDQELPGAVNHVVSRSDDDTWNIIRSYSDRDPGTYYLFNTKELTLEKLIRPYDWINPARMSEMRPIQYKSRDGLTIHGYLTLPAGKEPRNLPMVVNPHGGPWDARDEWGFNPEVQFLASRGYAVLQVNFRVSAGYGQKFVTAGYGQWGLAMQNDITDGVKWAIAQGYADPKRVAIYGASYGGFAAMAGLAFTPELYRCGIDYVGVTDINLLLHRMNRDWENERPQIELMVGKDKTSGDNLDKISPLKHADQIKVPVFFAYGELDPRVDLKHGTRLISALKSKGIPVEVMIKPNEEHGYHNLDNQVDFYSTMERFLAKYMTVEKTPEVIVGPAEVKEFPAK